MRKLVAAVFFTLAVPAAAGAQDFGRDWIDRVTHEVQTERGPLSTQPFEWHVVGGVEYYHDDNIFLMENDEIDDSVIVPFVGATLEYAEERFEAKAEFLGNYKFYSDEDLEDMDDDEERLYVKLRQVGAKYSFEITEVVARISDPIDVVFVDRAVRTVSTTVPRISFDLSPVWAIEGAANIGIVRYEEGAFSHAIDNVNFRTDATLVYRSRWGFDLLAQAGWQEIQYRYSQADGAPPDAWGYYGRGGIRGEILPTLLVEALVGASHMETDYYAGTKLDEEDETGDASVSLRWEAMPILTFNADYSRQFVFAGGADPYQLVNRVLFLAGLELNEYVTVRARFQFDHSDAVASGVQRDYFSTGGTLTVKPLPWVIIDGGVTFRSGEAELNAADTEYDNVIFHAGLAVTY